QRLPDPIERRATIAADVAFWNNHFRYTSLRLSGLVDHFLYCNQLARLIGCYPDFRSLFRTNLRQWWQAVTAPWNGCQFWLNEIEHRRRIFETYQRYSNNMISQNYIFLALAPLLPLIGLYTRARIALRDRHIVKGKRDEPDRYSPVQRGLTAESDAMTGQLSDPA